MLPSLHSFLRECCFTCSMLTWSRSCCPAFQFSTFTARNNVKFIWLMQCGPICVSCAMVWPSTWHMKYTYAENILGHDILCSDKKLLSFAHFTFDHQGLL